MGYRKCMVNIIYNELDLIEYKSVEELKKALTRIWKKN